MEKLREQYEKEVIPALMKKFEYKSVMQVPKLDKIVLNIGLGDVKENPKSLENAMNDLMQITGQRPVVTKAKKSIAAFKLREGVMWYTSEKEEYAEVTADDFVYAAQYVLDPINTSYNINSYKGVIEGATEYYDALSKGQEADFSKVGVKALDKYTVRYPSASHPITSFSFTIITAYWSGS